MSNPYIPAARRQELVLILLTAVLPNRKTLPARICGAFLDFPQVHVKGFDRVEYRSATLERFAVRGHFPLNPEDL